MAGKTNPKHAFWKALLITLFLFGAGLMLGVAFEANRIDSLNDFYVQSEISLMDVLALNDFVDLSDASCSELIQLHIDFANRIYEEAIVLDDYTGSERLTNNAELTHKRYDVLRTFLWINTMKTREKCSGNFSTVIYLYEFEPDDLAKKATQTVWSNILFDLKQEKGDGIILIPIAVDGSLESTNSLMKEFKVNGKEELPVVIINDKAVVRSLTSTEDLGGYL